MDITKYKKYYGYLLLYLAAYYTVILSLNYDAAYKTWESWAYPEYSINAYIFLVLTYTLNIGIPIILFLVGYLLVKSISVKWYVAFVFVLLLVLAPLLGKVALLFGIVLWGSGKYYAKNT